MRHTRHTSEAQTQVTKAALGCYFYFTYGEMDFVLARSPAAAHYSLPIAGEALCRSYCVCPAQASRSSPPAGPDNDRLNFTFFI